MKCLAHGYSNCAICYTQVPLLTDQDRITDLERQLVNMLCIIHRDGGHYIAEHGREKAYEDACEKLHEWKVACDELADERALRFDAQHQIAKTTRLANEEMDRHKREMEEERARREKLEAKIAAFQLIGHSLRNGVMWHDQNPHAWPEDTQFYALAQTGGDHEQPL